MVIKGIILVAVLLLRELQSLMYGLICSFGLKGCFYLEKKKISLSVLHYRKKTNYSVHKHSPSP